MIQCCVNGRRTVSEFADLPIRPAEIAAAAALAVEAGCVDLHVHPRGADGNDSLRPDDVASTVAAIRNAVPGVPVGVTTGAWISADVEQRVGWINSWTVLPDHASVNWHEPGAERVARALLDKGVGVEAGLFSGTGGAAVLRASGLMGEMLRLLAEVTETDPGSAVATAKNLLDQIGDVERPILLHGEDGGAWPVLSLALAAGLDTRVGLEDTLFDIDGEPARDNATLVRQAVALAAES
ncbi:3-keto-5-aminohexanoate cleavage protein [Saxibacter everestensis]|uniref:3-keto-5-aminohexanoate cleavage protein n=1 Tax=Saxibacter everestensis TaxID=2909229 RepID=A0ABY8QZG6_9MICO|nr:3-keto-5-aminohexanoate cleavage protein [Brevibacteriaceae bacterium ZFBP1038]